MTPLCNFTGRISSTNSPQGMCSRVTKEAVRAHAHAHVSHVCMYTRMRFAFMFGEIQLYD